MPLDDFLHAVADKLDAKPVFRGATDTVEFVPKSELQRDRFSTGLDTGPGQSPVRLTYVQMGVQEALRGLAQFVRVDIIVPAGLSGRVDGFFGELEWQDGVQAILEDSGNEGHVVVQGNGLVRIVP